MTYEKMNKRHESILDNLNFNYRDGYITLNGKPTRIKADNKNTALAHRFLITLYNSNFRIAKVRKTKNIDEKKELLKENMKYLNYIMEVLNMKEKYKNIHNRQVEKFGRTADNPLYISQNQLDKEIDFDKLGDNSLMELYCKNMYWSNRLTKEIDCIKHGIVSDDQNSIRDRNKLERVVSNVLGSSINKFSLLNSYDKYLKKDKEFKEFEKSDEYNELKTLIASDENTKSMKDNMNVVLPYLALSLVEKNLYLTKYRCIEDIFRIKNKDTKIEILNDVKSKDSKKIISISINGYNRPFMVHYDEQSCEDLAKKNNIEIGNSNNEGVKYLFPYKYTKVQRDKLELFNESKDERIDLQIHRKNSVKYQNKGDIVNDR